MCTLLAIALTAFRMLLVPAQFSDREFGDDAAEAMAIAETTGAYFAAQLGSGSIISVDITSTVALPGTELQYAGAPYTAFAEALRLADPAVDYTLYDGFLVLCAGDAMPPHTFYLEDEGVHLVLDGRTVNRYSVSNVSCGAGTVCHEILHLMGCPDFYDTDGEGSGGLSSGLGGSFSLMDMGNEAGGGVSPPDLCAPELDAAGLAAPKLLGVGTHTLSPRGLPHEYARVETGNEGEYYLIECRTPGTLILYHVDRSEAQAGYSDRYRRNLTARERWELNEVNCRPDRQCLDFCDAVEGVLVLDNVRSEKDGSVTFDLREPITISRMDIYQDAVIAGWTYDGSVQICTANLYATSSLIRTVTLEAYEDNHFAVVLDGLRPTGDYVLEISSGGASVKYRFRTKAYNSQIAPYIYLGSETRDSRGWFEEGSRIPLRLYNAPGATDVRWYFDGEPAECGPDGYFRLTRSGELRVEWGSQTIVKKILVK